MVEVNISYQVTESGTSTQLFGSTDGMLTMSRSTDGLVLTLSENDSNKRPLSLVLSLTGSNM